MGELVKGKKVIKIYNFCVRMDRYSQNIKVNAGEIFPLFLAVIFQKFFGKLFVSLKEFFNKINCCSEK